MALKAKQTLTNLDTAIASTSSVTANLNKTLDAINRPCSMTAPCGTLADIDRTLATARGALGQVEVAAKHENSQLSTLEAQERTLYGDLHSTLGHVDSFVIAGTNSINLTSMNTQPVLAEAHNSLAELTVSLTSLNKVVADPAIPATLKATQKAAEATADSMVEVKAMATEGHQWLHSMLHPTWPGRAYHTGLDLLRSLKPW